MQPYDMNKIIETFEAVQTIIGGLLIVGVPLALMAAAIMVSMK